MAEILTELEISLKTSPEVIAIIEALGEKIILLGNQLDEANRRLTEAEYAANNHCDSIGYLEDKAGVGPVPEDWKPNKE